MDVAPYIAVAVVVLLSVAAQFLLPDREKRRSGPRSPPESLALRGTETLALLISDGRAARGEPEKSG